VAERAGITGRRGPRARVIRRTLAAIAVGGAVAGLFACYLRLSATFAAGSDGASNALEAWDVAGPPARSYRFDSFTIMVWNENLLTLLASPPSRTPGDIGHL
jgi:hypothetical protein